MVIPPITLEVLPAGYGDSLLITCPVGRRSWRMLIDTGPDETYAALKARVAKLPPDRLGKRHIDLLVVTHIDRVEDLGQTQAEVVAADAAAPPVRSEQAPARMATKGLAIRVRLSDGAPKSARGSRRRVTSWCAR